MFCRTNYDCDNLEAFFNALGGGQAWRGLKESGKENPYSCVVLAGARSTGERREALQVGGCPAYRPARTFHTIQLLAACGTLTASLLPTGCGCTFNSSTPALAQRLRARSALMTSGKACCELSGGRD